MFFFHKKIYIFYLELNLRHVLKHVENLFSYLIHNCIPEALKPVFLLQINFVNSQHTNTNSKVFVLKILIYKINKIQIWYEKFN